MREPGAVKIERFEDLLRGFEPSFEFEPIGQVPESDYEDRIRRIRRDAVVAGHEVILINASMVGWYHTSNGYLRYVCDWPREGVLILPTDENIAPELLTIYSGAVLLPPAGEAVGIADIWQVGIVGREYTGRPGNTTDNVIAASVSVLKRMGLTRTQIGLIGDLQSTPIWSGLREALPSAKFVEDAGIIDRMQLVRSKAEQDQIRAASRLVSIGYEAACHVLRAGVTDYEVYAAFTYAQMTRGGETGDGYQLGVNEFGTHCGKPYGRTIRNGDILNLYVSNVCYHGYSSQTSRMMVVGDITAKQEEVLDMTVDAVRRAERVIRPGIPASALNNAAFEAYVERGYLDSVETGRMPFNWSAQDDGTPRRIPYQHVPDPDWEAQGRTLMHVYPATPGPHNPNLGHQIDMMGFLEYNITSLNTEILKPGMIFVLHAQWLEPQVAGSNIGDLYLVTEDGYENLSHHTPLEPYRVGA
ncbi:Xaa-Pro peptidase family protein [Microbacterium capsulatum]|uniref:Xaa-Pro peptidase family protein n=1 Tax=Microbacterium capsulatum TaxID=3041921 RepID=A0ABU0XI06_9MICO|nr:Xaa-Pro peptidase family protein [Microbacterium sp. ASV81]MDQ4214309.1 Xaa-Pro peptidase family protein [Microbacterium sp. ASV81]